MEKVSQPSDAELIAAINAGDWTAFDALYHRYRDWTYGLAWRFTADTTDAQDVVQEVFLYLARKFPGFELRASLTTLLYPAVKHSALALKRKRRRELTLVPDQDVPSPPDREPGNARAELAVALAGLSEAHREVLLMRFVDDMTLDEIAQALAIPLGTAKSRLHHALAAIRENPRLCRQFEP